MVGHTHEKIDACFSKVSDILRSLDDLVNLLPNVTNIKYVFGVFDVQSWLEDNILDLVYALTLIIGSMLLNTRYL